MNSPLYAHQAKDQEPELTLAVAVDLGPES